MAVAAASSKETRVIFMVSSRGLRELSRQSVDRETPWIDTTRGKDSLLQSRGEDLGDVERHRIAVLPALHDADPHRRHVGIDHVPPVAGAGHEAAVGAAGG